MELYPKVLGGIFFWNDSPRAVVFFWIDSHRAVVIGSLCGGDFLFRFKVKCSHIAACPSASPIVIVGVGCSH